MTWALDGAGTVNTASGALFVAMGLYVLAIRFRDAPNRAFGLFAIAWGLEIAVASLHVSTVGPFEPAPNVVERLVRSVITVLLLAAAAGLALVARWFPDPLERRDRRDVLVAAGLAAYYVLFDLWLTVTAYRWIATAGSAEMSLAGFVEIASFGVLWAAFWGVLVLLALRYPRAGPRRPAYLLMTAALGIYPAYWLGWLFAADASEPLFAGWAALLLGLLVPAFVVVGLWLRNSADDSDPARPRRMAWFLLGVALTAMLVHAVGGEAVSRWGQAVARVASVAILAYAIVRHQVGGIDVRLRWTISRSTIAAAFVAVFFVASEGAQILFGQGNEWVGLMAAGALVFAIAPLQRAAERLAEKAVPGDADPTASSPSRAEEAYRAVLRRYLRDGAVTRHEERALAMLAGELRLDAGRVFELREEVEHEGRAPRKVP